jgi:uncharacterized protein YeaO (DUF488 family)
MTENARPQMDRVRIKRAYVPPADDDGYRVLIDRLWPRGLSRNTLALDDWLKDVAPSSGLRQWFKHDPARWGAFQERYRAELSETQAREAVLALVKLARRGRVTLIYGAHDETHNDAVVLADVIRRHLRRKH